MSRLAAEPALSEHQSSAFDDALDLIRDDLEKVDQEFRKNLRSSVPIISAIGEHLLRSGGKRFRAKLLLLSARLCGYSGEDHTSMAGLIEFIHTATLLHDDVVDNAKLRRGIESANSKWGNEACVLVGDFLLQSVSPGWWKVAIGRSFIPSRGQPPSWRKGSWRS